jgi:hypothetical protein
MMQCRDIDELMVDFLYQELDDGQAEGFRAHVDGCARCGAELRGLQQMRETLRALPDDEPSPAVSTLLLHEAGKRARKAEEQGSVLAFLSRFFAPVLAHPAWAAAGSLLIVAGVAGFLSMKGTVDERSQPIEVTAREGEPAWAAPIEAAPVAPPASDLAAPAPEPEATGAPRGESKDTANAKAGKAKADVREIDRAAPPKEHVSKVPAPAVTASPAKPASRKSARQADVSPLAQDDRSPLDRELGARPEAARRDHVLYEQGAPAQAGSADGYAAPEPQTKQATPPAAPRARDFAGPQASSPPPGESSADRDEVSEQRALSADTSSRAAAKEAPEAKLLREAQRSASSGDCEDALAISGRIARMNEEFYRKRVSGDPSLRACATAERRKRPTRAPAQSKGVDALEAPAATEKAK